MYAASTITAIRQRRVDPLNRGTNVQIINLEGHNAFSSDYISMNKRTALLQELHCQRMSEYEPGGVLPYMGYIGMCRPIGYGF